MIAVQKIGKSFKGALHYNLNKLLDPDVSKRAELLDTSFASLAVRDIMQEVDAIRRYRSDLNRYVYHTSLNFSQADAGKLDNETLLSIAHDYLRESGYDKHQYLIVRHHDADHPHVHLLVNRIGFDGSVVSDSNNYKKSESIIRKLEQRYGLTPVKDSRRAAARALTKNEIEKTLRTGQPSNKKVLQELLQDLLRSSLQAYSPCTLTELIGKASQLGISFQFNQASTGRVSGVTYFYKDLIVTGKALGNQFKWGELIKQISYEQDRDGRAVSQANEQTAARFGSAEERGRRGGTQRAGTALADPAANPAERHGGGVVHQENGGSTGYTDRGSEGAEGNDSSAAKGTFETSADDTGRNGVSRAGDGRYSGAIAIQIADDLDDALLRRHRRGRSR